MPALLGKEQAKERVILLLGAGSLVADAMDAVGRTRKTYENWRAESPEWAAEADRAKHRATKSKAQHGDSELLSLSFAEWRKRFLGRETYPHMQNLVDVLEGRDPSWIHSAMTYEPASKHRCVVNIPPFHAKSQTITVDWVLYKLCMNPNTRIIIVSKRQAFAQKFLFQIKQRLESPLFADLQAAYGGPDGFKGDVWSASQIYLRGRDSDEKDPNVEAVGMGGQIYGSRADIIILDDCIVKSNAQQYEQQIDWIQAEVETRVKGGTIALVGTRLNTSDLYSEIIKGERYHSGKSPWTYLAMPMVLEFEDDPKDWVTLWPKSHIPMESEANESPDEDGMYPAWSGPDAYEKRASNPARTWELVFQQRTVPDDATFHPTCVWGSVDKRRKPGPLVAGAWGHPRDGAEGMQIVGSVDTAGTGEAFVMVYALDRATKHRWVLNAWTGNHTRISWYRERMKHGTEQYGVTEWVIESNAYASWLIHDEELVEWARNTGVRITPHYTGRNKQDPDFGVATMDTLFGGLREKTPGGDKVHDGEHIIHLPDPGKSKGIEELVNQLIVWQPGRLGKQLRMDGPMCLWFAETRARTYLQGFRSEQQTHSTTRFTTPRARRRMGIAVAG